MDSSHLSTFIKAFMAQFFVGVVQVDYIVDAAQQAQDAAVRLRDEIKLFERALFAADLNYFEWKCNPSASRLDLKVYSDDPAAVGVVLANLLDGWSVADDGGVDTDDDMYWHYGYVSVAPMRYAEHLLFDEHCWY